MNKFCGVLIAALVVLSQAVSAGVVTLKNGDRLQGDLVKLEAEVVIWASDSFGELSISKDQIENLQTATLLKINGNNDPCTLYGMDGADLTYSCQTGDSGRVPLLVLEVALPYEDYQAGAHTYGGRLALAGIYSRGNKIEDDWDLDSGVEFRRGDYRHIMNVEYEAKSQDNSPADEKFAIEYGLDWFFETRWFWYNDLAIGADESKDIDEIYTFGTGFGFQVWEVERTALSLKAGLTYVKELFDRPEDLVGDFSSSDNRLAWQWSTDYRNKLPLDAELFHTNSLIQSFEDLGDWLLETDTGINVPLGAGLFSEFKFEYDYDNEPQSGTRSEDTKFSVGIGYVW